MLEDRGGCMELKQERHLQHDRFIFDSGLESSKECVRRSIF